MSNENEQLISFYEGTIMIHPSAWGCLQDHVII